MLEIYIVSNASVVKSKLRCKGVLVRKTYQDAIITAQDSIAADFGYCDWNDYLAKRDPVIEEENGVYSIYDNDSNSNHKECYKIEKVVL